jgi:hypothetical protein
MTPTAPAHPVAAPPEPTARPCPYTHTFSTDQLHTRSSCVLTGDHGNTHEDARGRFWSVYSVPATAEQPRPAPGRATETAELVIADLRERARLGRAKYGEPHRADNGRDHLIDLYQEQLDAAQYIRAEIERRRLESRPAPDLAASDEVARLRADLAEATTRGLGWQRQCEAERMAVSEVHLLLMDPSAPFDSLPAAAKRVVAERADLLVKLHTAESRCASLTAEVERLTRTLDEARADLTYRATDAEGEARRHQDTAQRYFDEAKQLRADLTAERARCIAAQDDLSAAHEALDRLRADLARLTAPGPATDDDIEAADEGKWGPTGQEGVYTLGLAHGRAEQEREAARLRTYAEEARAEVAKLKAGPTLTKATLVDAFRAHNLFFPDAHRDRLAGHVLDALTAAGLAGAAEQRDLCASDPGGWLPLANIDPVAEVVAAFSRPATPAALPAKERAVVEAAEHEALRRQVAAWLRTSAKHFVEDMATVDGTSRDVRNAYEYVAEYLRAEARRLTAPGPILAPSRAERPDVTEAEARDLAIERKRSADLDARLSALTDRLTGIAERAERPGAEPPTFDELLGRAP